MLMNCSIDAFMYFHSNVYQEYQYSDTSVISDLGHKGLAALQNQYLAIPIPSNSNTNTNTYNANTYLGHKRIFVPHLGLASSDKAKPTPTNGRLLILLIIIR